MPTLTVSPLELSSFLANASLFVSPDDARPVLACIRLAWNGQELSTEATDSYAILRESMFAESEYAGTESVPPFVAYLPKETVRGVHAFVKSLGRPSSLGNAKITLELTSDPSPTLRLAFGSGSCASSINLPTYAVENWPRTEQLGWDSVPVAILPAFGVGAFQLARLGKLKVPGSSVVNLRFVAIDETKPILFSVPGSTITGLLMPVRLAN